jgi:predicted PurR-regulated permease PerM
MIKQTTIDLVPDSYRPKISDLLAEFNVTLAGFLRGQAIVCLVLGFGYGIALGLVDLNFAMAIGLMTGVLSFIPYVGSTIGLLTAVTVAFMQFGGVTMPAVVLAIFAAGQFLEGNFLTPKLVGESVGLHPVWVIFALMAGGNLMGFAGMMLAVPLAALIGVMVRHYLAWYRQSDFYRRHVH